jgi:hypothetical protein
VRPQLRRTGGRVEVLLPGDPGYAAAAGG